MIKPKRRRKSDNPYILDCINNKYIISFKDIKGIIHSIEVNKEIYDSFNQFELDDIKEINEYDRHIEHSEIYENNLYIRARYKPISLEDSIIQKARFKELKDAIDKLPEIQKRRIKKYYFEDKNEYKIALEEGSTHQAVHKSLKQAIEKLKKFLN